METFENLIIIAVVIAVSIAAVFWLSNIATMHTDIELLDIKLQAQRQGTKVTVTAYIKNRGTKPATIILAKINGQPLEFQATINPGETSTHTLETETSAQTLQVTFVTSTGKEYSLFVNVP
ncbi:hypothetical protein N186_01165 [Thermofilum adornatum]|uniref:CARDB domain-containing protein n=1 Tax=Thermofilum adornatum TaxID=1365176 RepID=S5ZUH8_9CREN|nr:hypothetical protein [Thermofilum adornatum]AGT34629.1 hypothetical protein N186_01165 [Thermofilum adornatum]